MIIVEGMDNTGKTTLVQKLAEELRLISVNNRLRPQSLQGSFAYLNAAILMARTQPTIFDRWQPISEPIYGPICRGMYIFRQQDIALQHDLVKQSGLRPVVIYCRPFDEVILRFDDRPQMAGVIKNADALIKAYDDDIEKVPFPVLRYDFEHDTYENLRDNVLAHLKANP